MNRRNFLKRAGALGAALALPTIIPARALGRDGQASPGNRIVVGCVGTGGKGLGNLKWFLNAQGVRVTAVCDVDRSHLEAARRTVNEYYGNNDCAAYVDFRELTARPDIDAVCVSTPDHWHTLPALEAMRAGKDVFVEKPLTLTIEEGKALRETARRFGRILQTGSQQRSDARFRTACELVRNGRLGRIERVEVVIPPNNRTSPAQWTAETPPPELDYDLWLGPAPWEPYAPLRCHYTFRFIRDYSGGQVTNWGAHHIDIAQWGLGMDGSGPVAVRGRGEYPDSGLFNTATRVDFECTYANGARLTCQTNDVEENLGTGTRFIGSEGWLFVTRGKTVASRPEILREPIGPDEIRLPVSLDHVDDFVDAIRTRREPITGVEVGHRSATICHLGNIAMQLGRPLQWDPVAERFIDDAEANRMTSRPMRGAWHL